MVLLVKQTLYNQLVTVTLHQDKGTNSSDIAAKQMNTFHITYVEVWTGGKKGVQKTQSLKKGINLARRHVEGSKSADLDASDQLENFQRRGGKLSLPNQRFTPTEAIENDNILNL